MSNVLPAWLCRFADESDYRLMDPTIAPVVEMYIDTEFTTLDPEKCKQFGVEIAPTPVIEIDLNEDES